ncbi:MAG: NADH-quinone oxidoreductase subunit H [Cytophagaceae bacterium]|nr:NADH-quinone oxidoreductase subunit H [Cytophagaceae bacterium]
MVRHFWSYLQAIPALLPDNPVLQSSGLQTGIFSFIGVVSLDMSDGILMAGWASNNKYSL